MKFQRVMRLRGAAAGAVCAVLCSATVLVLFGQVRPRPRPRVATGEIRGFVSTATTREIVTAVVAKVPPIRLPRIQVRAKNVANNQLSAAVTTNVFGHFITPRLASGKYQLCVAGAGFVSNCNPQVLTVGAQGVVLNFDLSIAPQGGAVHGRVLLADGGQAPCATERQVYGTDVTAKVWGENGGGQTVAGPVVANIAGQYVLPKIPGAGSYALKASCDAGQGVRNVALTAADLTNAAAFDIGIGNHAPMIVSLTPTIGGNFARRADPGQTVDVTVKVTDTDGDPLHYKWASDSPGFVSADAPALHWKLPNAAAANAISVQVTDGKGGYAFRTIGVPTGPNAISFAGAVRDRATGRAIPGAEVTLVGSEVTRQMPTDNNGGFRLAVPDTVRYVLNVDKVGYALVSRIFFSTATGLDILMDPVQKTSIDIGKGATVTFERKNLATVKLAPNSLVDGAGKQANGPVFAYLHAYDLDTSNPIPGDQSAKTLGGKDVRLESYGAIDMTVTDATGIKLQLASGATAEIAFSIPPAGMASAPATIPLLTYDVKTGYWMEEGVLTKTGNRYAGTVNHFSAFNADTVFTGTACIEFNVANQDVPPFPFVLHVDFSTAGGPRHNDFQVTETNNVLQRLPPNAALTMTVYPGSGPGAPGGPSPHVLGTFHWNSGAATGNDTYPVVNYSICNGFDTAPLTGNPAKPAVVELTVPSHDPFITGFGPGNQTTSDAYYTQLGVLGGPTLRNNFQNWKATNGFNNDPTVLVAGEGNAQYFNNGDLQLGRDMHCLKTVTAGKTHVACYVSNYGSGPIVVQGDPQTGVQEAVDHSIQPAATVAMEYDDQGLSPPPIDSVQFYAYKGDGSEFENPALDSEGNKFLPQNCMACHGGTFNNTTNRVEGASFLAFDVFSFLYDNRVAKHKGLEDQQEPMRILNSLAKATKPNNTNPNEPMVSFINGLYAWSGCSVDTIGCRAQDGPTVAHPADQGPYTPPGWQTNATTIALYQTIPRPSCRTCHLAQSNTFPPDWTTYAQMTDPGNSSDIQFRVCVQTLTNGVPNGSHKLMPHAEVPYKAFWFSSNPSGPAFLGDPATGLGFTPNASGDRCPQ